MLATQGLELARAVKDKHVEGLALLNLGHIIAFSGEPNAGIPMMKNGLTLLQEVGDTWAQATAIGVLAMNHSDLERSRSFLTEALRLHRELDNLSGIANCLNQLAERDLWAGEFSRAAQALAESIEIYRKTGSQSGEAATLGYLGSLAYWQGNYQQAYEYYDQCISLGEKINLQMSTLWARAQRAHTILRQGEVQRAHTEFENALRRMQKAGVMPGVVFTIEGFASLYVNLAQPERAAQLVRSLLTRKIDHSLVFLLVRIRGENPNLADTLFREALAVADQHGLVAAEIESLSVYVLPTEDDLFYGNDPLADPARHARGGALRREADRLGRPARARGHARGRGDGVGHRPGRRPRPAVAGHGQLRPAGARRRPRHGPGLPRPAGQAPQAVQELLLFGKLAQGGEVHVSIKDDAPAFFGQETRYGHRVYGGVLINLGR